MIKQTAIQGLCSNCKNSRNCLYLRNSSQAINRCEEFELKPPKKDQKEQEPESYSLAEILAELQVYTGLCQNCDLRKECGLRSPDKVIWQCNEYQ